MMAAERLNEIERKHVHNGQWVFLGSQIPCADLAELVKMARLTHEMRAFLIDMHTQGPDWTVEESGRLLARIDAAINSQRKEGGEG